MADSRHLACGACVDDLLTQVTERTPARDPEHQRSCPHCRAALAELTGIWAPVNDLAAEDVRAPAGLLAAVMERVRALPRHSWHAVILTDRGETRIAARVVGAVARLAAESVPHVTLALGGGRTAREHSLEQIASAQAEAATDIGVAGTTVVVDVKVVVDTEARIPAVAQQVRTQIARHIAAFTGLTTAEVNITVVDVQLPER